MISNARRALLLLCALFLFAASSASAQTATYAPMGESRMSFAIHSQIAAALETQGMHWGFAGYTASPIATGQAGWKLMYGSLDAATGYGELACTGEFQFILGSLLMDLRNINYVNTAQGQSMTAAVFLNGAFQGRQTIFNVTSGRPFAAVRPGRLQSGNSYYVLNPAFAAEFVTFFQVPQLASILNGSSFGFVSLLLLLDTPLPLTY